MEPNTSNLQGQSDIEAMLELAESSQKMPASYNNDKQDYAGVDIEMIEARDEELHDQEESHLPRRLFVDDEPPRSVFTKDSLAPSDEIGKDFKKIAAIKPPKSETSTVAHAAITSAAKNNAA